MIPLAIPNMCGNESKYLKQCIDTNFVSSVGKFVDRFENAMCESTNAKFAVATNSGTSALHLALTVLGVTSNDLVIIPSFTFIASANSVRHTGASPILIDIDPLSWTMDPEVLEDFLSTEAKLIDNKLIHIKSKKHIKAIMPVFTLGNPADMDPINVIAKKYKLHVIIDAAAGLGTTYKGRSLADISDMATISFNGNKIITSGGGGMIVGNSNYFLSKARHLSTTARSSINYDHDEVGFNYRLTNIQAAVGCAQIESLNKFLDTKRKIHLRYKEAFLNNEFFDTFPEAPWGKSSHWFSGVVLKKENKDFNVNYLVKKLEMNGIQSRPFWKPVHLQRPYSKCYRSSMNNCDSIWSRVLTLPCSTNLTEMEQEKVIKVLKKVTH